MSYTSYPENSTYHGDYFQKPRYRIYFRDDDSECAWFLECKVKLLDEWCRKVHCGKWAIFLRVG